MKITLADWIFEVDTAATAAYTLKCSTDHCTCAYCRNYYETIDIAHPTLRPFLRRFGILAEGPSEVMPLEPTLVMAGYRVTGRILTRGKARMHADHVPVHIEESDEGTFLLWVGEMELPWNQPEPMDDVISPANQPEFLLRMNDKWAQLNGVEVIYS